MTRSEFVVGKTADQVTLLRDLQVVHGRIVVRVTRATAEIARDVVEHDACAKTASAGCTEFGAGRKTGVRIGTTEITENAVRQR